MYSFLLVLCSSHKLPWTWNRIAVHLTNLNGLRVLDSRPLLQHHTLLLGNEQLQILDGLRCLHRCTLSHSRRQ